MGKKKNNEVQGENNAYFERIKVLEKEIESYRADGQKLGDEILALRRSVSSYKGSNSKMKAEIEQQKAVIKNLKQLNKEADELNEQNIADKDIMKNIIADKDNVISKLSSQVSDLRIQVSEQAKNIDDLCVEKENLSKALEFEQMPWWKKIF